MERRIIKYDTIDSTNRAAECLIKKENRTQSFFVVADYQTNGKGRGDHEWNSEIAKNLLFSWTVYPEFLSVSHQFCLSELASVAISRFLSPYLCGIQIKWPNDIYIQDKKIGGILIEHQIMGTSLQHSIIGIGLNVNQLTFPRFSYRATSLGIETGSSYELEALQDELFSVLEGVYSELEEGNNLALSAEYQAQLYRKDEASIFIDEHGEFEGVIRGVNEFGELLVQTECQIRAFGMHEISLKPT